MAAKLVGLACVLVAALCAASCHKPQNPPATLPAEAQKPADPAVTVFQLAVKAANYDQVQTLFKTERDYGMGRQSTPALNVVLHVATNKYDLVGVDRAVIESLTDEAGHDLTLGMTLATSRLFFPLETNITLDHKHGFIMLLFPKPPSPDTRRMTMRGTVLARSGGKQQTLTFDNVPFTKGSKFKVLGHDYTLDNIWTYDSQPDQLNFSVASDGSYDEIRAIRFLSPDGKTVAGNIWRVDRNIRNPTELLCRVTGEKPQAMRIEVDTYEKPVELAIPFQLNLDLGALALGEPPHLVTTATLPATPLEEKIKSVSQVVAMTMTSPITEQQAKEWFGERSSVNIFRHPGLSMQIKVHVPDRKMVRLIDGPGMPLAFMDNTGSSLLATASISSNADQSGMRETSAISRDGHDALITVAATKLPAPGAREIRFKGKIGAVMEESEKVGETPGITLLPGTTFKVGDVEMKVTSVRAAGAAGNGMFLTISASQPIHGTVVLLDEKGKPLASAPIGEDRFRGPAGENAVMLTLPKAPDTATVQLKTTTAADAVPVPVEFTVPIGLGK